MRPGAVMVKYDELHIVQYWYLFLECFIGLIYLSLIRIQIELFIAYLKIPADVIRPRFFSSGGKVKTSLVETYHSGDIKLGLAYIFIDILSLTLWYSLHNKRKNLRLLILFLNTRRNICPSVDKNYHRWINIFVLGNVIATILFAVVFACFTQGVDGAAEFWTLGSKFSNKKYETILNFIGGYAYYLVYSEYPISFTLSTCKLVYRYGLVLQQYNEDIKNLNYSSITAKCFEIANRYTAIEQNIHLLKDTLSFSLFLMLVSGFFNIYTALSYILTYDVPLHICAELSSNACTGAMIIILLTIYCSRIPEYMMAIKGSVGSVIDKNQMHNLNLVGEVRFLTRIENKDIVYLSAGGMINFTKSFLLPAFGTILTYSILIVKLE
ncbi:uncharacterized protein TNCT_193691 [Trichonephila clavata]|uniref:Gustatory receptor n=1 Tax=Trichonephila clavata TaxID=2740835 RepID=A0A8X6KQI0_TRICU|nr:uncharacterized protein TNCT_193691 [Trichonephila clavata]